MEYHVDFKWDDESGMWVATSPKFKDLALASESYDALVESVKEMIPKMAEANSLPKATSINIVCHDSK